jgi:adenine-specific DNA-methyltransferase
MAKKTLEIDTLRHNDATRINIPTAEYEGVMSADDLSPVQVAYQRRNRDLDPQLVWRGKDEQDWSDLVVVAPPLYIQEKVHPKVLIDDLKRETSERRKDDVGAMVDLFGDFNGLKDQKAATEFYQHEQHWSNRMISGDSLAVMASLAEREGLRGKVQCIFFDPPYGIKFNSNFQWSTTSRDVKDGARDHMSREPEMVRAFRDTWRDGIHSYLTYLRDRLTVARDLLHDSGSIFVQIGDENVHRVRALMDEVFGEKCFLGLIAFSKTSGLAASGRLSTSFDYLIWYEKTSGNAKYRELFSEIDLENEDSLFRKYTTADGFRHSFSKKGDNRAALLKLGGKFYRPENLTKPGPGRKFEFEFEGRKFGPGARWFGTTPDGMERLSKANRLDIIGNTLVQIKYFDDAKVRRLNNFWSDTSYAGFNEDKIYVVQTSIKVIERCILMTTDPGDLVLDPTCGSGTTAFVAEQWGRRWITIDTSRVSLALARSRIMGARYQYYFLADSPEGQRKEGEITRSPPKTSPTRQDVRLGFVYSRVPRVTLKSIVNNAEIDVIYDKWQQTLEPLRVLLNSALGKAWKQWEIPRDAAPSWSADARATHAKWWDARIARQKETDASIAAKADSEYLYDKPYVDNGRVRVAGPFTVESLSPHRTMIVGADDELIDPLKADQSMELPSARDGTVRDFAKMILENLRVSGVQQSAKADKITFVGLSPWAGGGYICAEGTYMEGQEQRRAGIVVGPEFGSLSRADLVAAAKEAGEVGFDVLIACAFNYDAAATEFDRLGRIPVLKARMNPDLMMAKDLKTTAHGNLFVVFGEPDIEIHDAADGMITVKVFGVDVFKPQTGEVVSAGTDGIALWMIDTDYNEESFFVRHAYFLGANDPYKALKTTLKAEIDEAAWSSLNSDVSRPFPKPKNSRIAVKVINHLGDEVMKVVNVR